MVKARRAVSLGVSALIVIVIILIVGFGVYLTNTFNSTSSNTAGHGGSSSSSSTGISQTANSKNSISLQGFSLCPSNCLYPSPYLSGNIVINGSVPISSIVMYINGTYNGYALQNPSVRTLAGSCTGNPDETCTQEAGGTCVGSAGQTSCTYQYASCYIESGETSCTAVFTGATNTLTVFDEIYKGSLPSSLIPAVANDTYVITCVGTFEDGSQSNATTVATAT